MIDELKAVERRPEKDGRRRRRSAIYLPRQLESMRTRIAMLYGARLTFDEESRALYDAEAPTYPDSHFQTTFDEFGRRLPGGPLIERDERFRESS